MRKLFYLVAATLFPLSVLAADMAPVSSMPEPAEEVLGHSWTGFYLGSVGTYAFGDVKDTNNAAAKKQDIDGWLGGVTVGYNHQFSNNFVLGAEGDISFGDVGKSWGGANQYDPYYGEDSMTAYGTARLRAGYAFDRFMPYVTGGIAWGRFEHTLGCNANRVVATNGCQNRRGGSAFETTKSDSDIGYVIGAGAEYAVTEKLSLKGEYLFSDFGKHKTSLVDPNYPALSERSFDTQSHMIRVGLNYKF